MRTLWVDAGNGAAGDMLLAALLDAGADLPAVRAGLARLAVEPVELLVTDVRRHGLRARHVTVRTQESPAPAHRGPAEVAEVIRDAGLPEPVTAFALATFDRLAQAEARVHGVDPSEIHFHEVGALDAIADVVGAGLALHDLNLLEDSVRVVSPVATGHGTVVRAAHGPLPVPAPAVVELLAGAGAPLAEHPARMELTTPTGAALLATLATGWGPPPPVTLRVAGVGAGSADPAGHANVLRVLIGDAATRTPDSGPGSGPGAGSGAGPGSDLVADAGADWLISELFQVEATVDDLDPRVWPDLLERLRSAGAADAWCVPVLMRKGRPGQVLAVLVDAARLDLVCRMVFTDTSTLGLRVRAVERRSLRRDQVEVAVAGGTVRVKRGYLDGAVVTAQPEYEDAARLATETGRPVADILRAATVVPRAQDG